MPSDRQTEIQAPIPLIDPEGKVRAWACGLCHRVAANVSIGGDRDQARAREADSSREYAARCCVCRRCGIQTSDRYGSMCVACRAVESAEWAAQAEAERPQREAREAAARVAAEQRAREALVDIPALSARDWDDDEEYAAFLMPFVLAELSRVQQERDEALKQRDAAWKDCHICHHDPQLRMICSRCHRSCPMCRAKKAEAERDALTQEIATLRQQIGEMADGIEALAGPRADDYGRIVTQVAKSLRALLQKGQ